MLLYVVLLVGISAFATGDDIEIAKEAAAPANKTPSATSQGDEPSRKRLVHHLFDRYEKTVNPDDLNVKFGMALIDFHVCDERQTMESNIWLRFVWVDKRLSWNASEFGGVGVLRFNSNLLWKPDITLYNSVDPEHQMRCWDSNVLIYPSGEVLWVPPCKIFSHCKLNLKREPYGEQTCSMKFGSWTFDGLTMDMNFYDNKTHVDLSDYRKSTQFEILSTTGEKNSRYYPCCAEPYIDITFNMTIKRIPGEELMHRL